MSQTGCCLNLPKCRSITAIAYIFGNGPRKQKTFLRHIANVPPGCLPCSQGIVIYDLDGATWVYTSPEPLVFVRYPIVVDYIEGDQAYLVEGPPAGTEVATVGVAELYGADTGVGK